VRKIRKLLNTSPNNYVRTMRVSIAAELLRSSQGNNISDICYATGFSSLSYFSKCFKEQYGVTPTEFIAKK
jgi:transcriptional regulator GlxA family with amidase domain